MPKRRDGRSAVSLAKAQLTVIDVVGIALIGQYAPLLLLGLLLSENSVTSLAAVGLTHSCVRFHCRRCRNDRRWGWCSIRRLRSLHFVLITPSCGGRDGFCGGKGDGA